MQKFVKMDDSIINSISEQIIRPCFLNDCVYSTKTIIQIMPEYNNLLEIVFSVKLKCDSNFNLYELLKWIKYILSKYNNMITFINWDDTKEFDFQTDYDTFLYFKIENFHNFLKNIPDDVLQNTLFFEFKHNYTKLGEFENMYKNNMHINKFKENVESLFNDQLILSFLKSIF